MPLVPDSRKCFCDGILLFEQNWCQVGNFGREFSLESSCLLEWVSHSRLISCNHFLLTFVLLNCFCLYGDDCSKQDSSKFSTCVAKSSVQQLIVADGPILILVQIGSCAEVGTFLLQFQPTWWDIEESQLLENYSVLNSQSVKHDVKSSSEQPLHFLALKTETEQKTFLLVIVDFGLLSFNGNILWSISHAELCCDHNFCLVNSKKVLKLLSTMGPSLHEHLNVDSGTNFNL